MKKYDMHFLAFHDIATNHIYIYIEIERDISFVAFHPDASAGVRVYITIVEKKLRSREN